MSSDPPVHIVHPNDSGYDMVYNHVARLQKGLCYHCNKAILRNKDVIVARSHMPPKYYHEECAKKLKII